MAPVGSSQGQMIFYSLTVGDTSADHAQVLWPGSLCGWIFTLTAPPGERETYVPALLQLAGPFKEN